VAIPATPTSSQGPLTRLSHGLGLCAGATSGGCRYKGAGRNPEGCRCHTRQRITGVGTAGVIERLV
jgi:hypothetical protein